MASQSAAGNAKSLILSAIFISLATGALAASLAIFWYGLDTVGVCDLLAIHRNRFILFGLGCSWIGGIASSYNSRDVAVWSVDAHAYDDVDAGRSAGDLRPILGSLASRFGITRIPELLLYPSSEVNAFTVGWRRNKFTIALTTALVDKMSTKDAETVLAREMLKFVSLEQPAMLFMHGMINTFTIVPARMLAFVLGTSLRTYQEETPSDGIEKGVILVLEVAVAGLASLVVRAFSRGFELRADARVANLLGEDRLKSCLNVATTNKIAKTHREIFVEPLKLVAPPPAWEFLSYHRAIATRLST